ncbi:leucine rich repeat family protein [Stylonychia lemnae]|uniref:Leucine rich repeat family protein n=1 Tax=Stylonychia lemnae TaxID=5949 RepID=A0A077ZUK9_STYLE|nr:leucine rich repeat family protein [Stylonychia lemnae]|eukprot:CDW72990.1 leucine rich repeat family protein [Stylonychia lemnae]
MFKKFDSTSITGVKADEKFAIEGASAYGKEKIVSELAVQQEQDKLKKETEAKSILHGGTLNKVGSTDPTGSNSGLVGQNNKISPFRSQRNASIGSVAANNAMAHNGMMQISGIKGQQAIQKCVKLIKPDPNMIRRLLNEEKDERYRYLLRHGNILNIESETLSLYVELPQIPNIIIVYRRPSEREMNVEKMNLDSRNLKHIPLLEGEEKIKYLNLQNNEIVKIENLVSLPNLTFLDLSMNKIKEISNFSTVEHLRVLILSKNMIESIRNLDAFKNLDVLDLHENKITKIDNLSKLVNLRVLNLSNNSIEVIENLGGLKALVELNLRKNKINLIKELNGLNSLQKLYLSNNNIGSVENVKELPSLTDITLENNPIEKIAKFQQIIKDKFPSVQFLNLQKINLPLEETITKKEPTTPVSNKNADKSLISNNEKKSPNRVLEMGVNQTKNSSNNVTSSVSKPKIESNVIKIIQREWEKECERLDAKKNGYKPKQQVGDKSLVQSGHAEIEANRILYIFGNALEVLQRSEFYEQVEEMHMQYVRFDLIVYHANLDKLKKFTKLKKLVLSNNYLNSFILLSKIEFNGMPINDFDKKVAKQQFQLFDKILSIQNIFTKKTSSAMDPTKRQEQRLKSKKNLEFAHIYVLGLIDDCTRKEEDKSDIDSKLEKVVKNIINTTTMELIGDSYQMERKLHEGISKSVKA